MTVPAESKPKLRWLLLLWFAIALVWGLSGLLLFGSKDRGTFGDMFGAVNALFTGLAFATLIYTAWMQREELSLQRKELEATRKQLERQGDEFAQQTLTFRLQRFENTFFSMLRTHGEIVGAMDLVNENGTVIRSRDCFQVWYARLTKAHAKLAVYPDGNALPTMQQVYGDFYRKHQSELGHYFRHLYHIFKFVANADVPNKRHYTSLVRAQLSAYEHLLLFYNCLSINGIEKFKPIVEQFALLENMPITLLIMPDLHTPLYEISAFGDGVA